MLGFWSCNLSLVPNIKTCWHLISLFLLKIVRATSRYYQKIGRRKNWSSCTFLHIYICRWWWFGGFLWCMSFVMWTEVLSCCGSVPECIASLVSCNILFFKLSWFLGWVGELERLENSFGWLMAFKEEDELMYGLLSLWIYCELLLPNSSVVEGVGCRFLLL